MRVRPWVWLAWAAGFGVLEWIAVVNDEPNDTLTRTIVENIPGMLAGGLFVVAVVAAFKHWWDAYHREDGNLAGSDGRTCSCSLFGPCQCEGKDETDTCWCIRDECPCTGEAWRLVE